MNKKAVSPLISTVLLLVFAVFISVIITIWGKQLIINQADIVKNNTNTEIICGLDVNINVVEMMGLKQLCYDSESQKIELIIENGPKKEITGIQIIIIGEDSIVNSFINKEFQIMDLKKVVVDYNGSLPIKELKLMPQIEGSHFCLESEIIERMVFDCE